MDIQLTQEYDGVKYELIQVPRGKMLVTCCDCKGKEPEQVKAMNIVTDYLARDNKIFDRTMITHGWCKECNEKYNN